MKTLKLEITREETAIVYVTIPDDFDEDKLHRAMYARAINLAVQAQSPEWDKDYEGSSISVETIEDAGGEEGTDISEALREEDEYVKRIKNFRL